MTYDPEWNRLRARLNELEQGGADPAEIAAVVEQLHERYLDLGRGGVTAGGLPYPYPTDPIAEGADAIRALAEALEPRTFPLPDPVERIHPAQISVTATAFTAHPGLEPIELDLPAPCWVEVAVAAWISVTAGDVRLGIGVTGATTSPPATPTWGAVGITGGATTWVRPTKLLLLNAGVNTVTAQVYRTGTAGSQAVSYAILSATPLRWA